MKEEAKSWLKYSNENLQSAKHGQKTGQQNPR